jgi:hypothetical protein
MKRRTDTEKMNVLRDYVREAMSQLASLATPDEVETVQYVHNGTDKFYLTLVNEIIDRMQVLRLPVTIPDGFVKRFSLACAAYVCDFVNETHIWQSVRVLYNSMFGKCEHDFLPFFDTTHDDYYTDDINIEDLKFVCWYTLCRFGQENGKIYSPLTDFIDACAALAYDVIITHIEYVPENQSMQTRIKATFVKGDMYQVRAIAFWLVALNPLTAMPGEEDYYDRVRDVVFSGHHDKINESMAAHQAQSHMAWTTRIAPLGCLPQKLLAEMARQYGNSKLANDLDNLEFRSLALYTVERQDKKYFYVKSESNESMMIDKLSMMSTKGMSNAVTLATELTKVGDVWMVNGIISSFDEKIEPQSQPVSTMTPQLKETLASVLKKNRGQKVFFCRNFQEISQIVGINVSSDVETHQKASNFLLMLSDSEPPQIAENKCHLFRSTKNPFYNAKCDRDRVGAESFDLITRGIPLDVMEYIIEQKLLPYARIYAHQGKRVGTAIVQDNMKFFASFYRAEPDFDDDDEYDGDDE